MDRSTFLYIYSNNMFGINTDDIDKINTLTIPNHTFLSKFMDYELLIKPEDMVDHRKLSKYIDIKNFKLTYVDRNYKLRDDIEVLLKQYFDIGCIVYPEIIE